MMSLECWPSEKDGMRGASTRQKRTVPEDARAVLNAAHMDYLACVLSDADVVLLVVPSPGGGGGGGKK
jgi:hypothetical protein